MASDRCRDVPLQKVSQHQAVGRVNKLLSLGLEPPPWVIVPEEHTLAHILQPTVSLPSVPACIFTLEDIPQNGYETDIPHEISHSLR